MYVYCKCSFLSPLLFGNAHFPVSLEEGVELLFNEVLLV